MEKKKINKSMKKKIILLSIGLILLIIDQIAKILFINKNIVIIQNVLELNYYENTGIAFGILSGDIMLIMVVTAIILGIIVKLLRYYLDKQKFLYSSALILVLVGGLSNLLDRFLHGFVIDYIQIKLFSFPIINLADIFITIGIVILFVLIIRDIIMPENKRKKIKEEKIKKKEEKQKEKQKNKNNANNANIENKETKDKQN